MRLACYVDDPVVTLSGSTDFQSRQVTHLVLLWCALGLPFNINSPWHSIKGALLVEIKADLLEDIRIALDDIQSKNVVHVRPLRRLLGKLSHVASLVPTVRPFLQPVWASLSTANVHHAPPLRQILHSVTWLRSFFADTAGLLQRQFTSAQHFGGIWPWRRCPYDKNGTLYIAVTRDQCSILGCEFGSSSSQQAMESLAILVAVRQWHSAWEHKRARLTVYCRPNMLCAFSFHCVLAGVLHVVPCLRFHCVKRRCVGTVQYCMRPLCGSMSVRQLWLKFSLLSMAPTRYPSRFPIGLDNDFTVRLPAAAPRSRSPLRGSWNLDRVGCYSPGSY
eukprot:4631927-Amphidinium_carterae.4